MIRGLLREPDHLMPAIHESGHAIAAIVLQVPLIGIALPDAQRRRQAGGVAIFGTAAADRMSRLTDADLDLDAPGTTHAPGGWRPYLVVLAAGAAAESHAGYWPSDSDWSDAVAAGNLAAKALRVPCYHADVRRLLRRCEAEAATIVGSTWPWITRTAQALEIRRRLTAADVRALRTPQKGNQHERHRHDDIQQGRRRGSTRG